MYYEFLIRFAIGGAVIAGTTLIAELFGPKLGGIIATIPAITIVSLLIVDSAMGEKAAIEFAKGIIFGNIPWFAFIFAVILLTQRIGLVRSLSVGLIIWVLLIPVASRLSQHI